MIRIGIDPDVNKSGCCVTQDGKMKVLKNLTFFELLDELKNWCLIDWGNGKLEVYVECGFLNKGNWRVGNYSKQSNAKTAENVGRNHEVAKKICEMCDYLGIKYHQIRPIKSKINAKTFKGITKYDGRTNQEQRDAAMLIWGL